ncbi:MAG TPA: SsrA-binding protein SmpB [Ornithinimicrobium sp.]|uniref:SsrA-binding protein SmpB n=1 Tax=Ornithinimicrobium sp. TaxID=1977084 RepID=UPI002B4899C8|nr:SsrA-binding protein SmpB [Ornithinimicrobium sp.]HKJ11245.1 SsrA-binding protein SmpB [Ornithinimicrobium sp.]
MVKERGEKVVATNRRARYEYHLEDVVEAGLVLTGTEVKSLREGRATIGDGYCTDYHGELYLENVHIPEYLQGTWTNHSAKRRRKLLLHREQIEKMTAKAHQAGHTIVPLRLYFKDGRAKVEIALAKGKKLHDKRQALRERQDRREAERAMSAHLRKHG